MTLQLLYEHFSEKLVICYTKNAKELAEFYKSKGVQFIVLTLFLYCFKFD